MADYYPLLFGAISRLETNDETARLAIYDRARRALLNVLHANAPSFREADIRSEVRSLEEAIKRVERSNEFEELERSMEVLLDSPNSIHEDGRRRGQQREHEERERRILVTRAKLAEVSSPEPLISIDGRLDAGPNASYDVPLVDNDLPTLPIRQRSIIGAILAGMPRNAPKYVRYCLESYDDELKARGVQPIVGLLKDMAAIIEADVLSPSASAEWLDDGLSRAFNLFADNHDLFIQYFPLDREREELYSRTFVDESLATGPSLSKPFTTVAEAVREAGREGLTTDDFVTIVDKMTEFAKVVATQPSQTEVGQIDHESAGKDSWRRVSSKKRVLLSGLGFLERVYNLLGSSATLLGPPAGNALLTALHDALIRLSKLIDS